MTNRLNQDCVENLFSIIHGKGGKRDNPDAREFRASYRQVVFDQLLLPSEESNCKVDTDDILLNLTNPDRANNAGILSGGNGLTQNVPDKVPGAEIIPVIKPPASVPLQNVEAYMAGYHLRKSGFLNVIHINQIWFMMYPRFRCLCFFKEKAYKETNTLEYPTEPFIKCVDEWEAIFSVVFLSVIHMAGVLRRLCKNAENLGEDLICSATDCYLKYLAMVRLYMKVRLHFALKTSNLANKVPGLKRNRKLLKLQHV